MSLPDEHDEYNEPISGAGTDHAKLGDRVLLISERLRDVRRRLGHIEERLAEHERKIDTHTWQVQAALDRLIALEQQRRPNGSKSNGTDNTSLFRVIIFALLGIIGTLATGKALDVAGMFN